MCECAIMYNAKVNTYTLNGEHRNYQQMGEGGDETYQGVLNEPIDH